MSELISRCQSSFVLVCQSGDNIIVALEIFPSMRRKTRNFGWQLKWILRRPMICSCGSLLERLCHTLIDSDFSKCIQRLQLILKQYRI